MSESSHSTAQFLDPENAARVKRAGELHRARRPGEAAQLLEQVTQEAPQFARAWFLLGFVEGDRGRFEQAARALERAAGLTPADAETQYLLAVAYTRLGSLDDAVRHYREAVRLAPGHAAAHTELGLVYQAQGDVEQAVRQQRLAAAAAPGVGRVHNNLGVALREANRPDEAVEALRTAVQLEPGRDKHHLNLSLALKDCGAYEEAIGACLKGLERAPRSADLHAALGTNYSLAQKSEQAIASLTQAFELDPANAGALGRLIREKAQACDWSGLERLGEEARRRLDSGAPTIHPFVWLSLSDSPALQRRVADRWAADLVRRAGAAVVAPAARRRARIRLGYLSADFHDHATAYLIAELIELHDRSAFEVIAYSSGRDDGGSMRRRLEGAFDRFVDISREPDATAARRIADDGIDILVDLKGYTHEARSGVVALRPAPLIVNYLGYPGTLGEGIADYVIGDPTVTPLDSASYFYEKLVLMPDAYQPNDRQRAIGVREPRARYGLPEQALVLCCFNQPYKIGPERLDVWCEALRAAPDAVLWLYEARPLAIGNLRRELGARGVDPERLIAARGLPLAQHLARLSCADLFLDTYPYSAHTTASDALWTGVPVVSQSGETFASRVAASLLRAVGLGELVTHSLAAYRALVLELVADRGRLAALRERLAANRPGAPLFDSVRYTANLERAYREMWERRLAALPPEHIDLSAGRG
jgi:predicted O-linked N-acetylglucosamine transferase (SPINDLY family)